MGNNLFKAGISKAINKALGGAGMLLPLTLAHDTPTTRTIGDLASGLHPNTSTATARGFIDDYKVGQIDGTLIKVGDMKVLIIGDSISPALVPVPGDRITIEGRTRTIVKDGVTRDPDAATYTCQVRG